MMLESFTVQGVSVPAVGLGTFQSDGSNSDVTRIVLEALESGYRHVDTAAAYGNERQVGEAVKQSGIPRSRLFITTKLAQTWHDPASVREALDNSLEALQMDYVDLYLIHFPHAYQAGSNHETVRLPNGKPCIDYELSGAYPETWAAMEALVDEGKTRLIGLSNFNILKTKRVLETARIRPAVNQVELHPYLPQLELLEFCSDENIHLMAHQPLGGRPVAVVNPNGHIPGPLLDPIRYWNHYKKSPAQVLLSWAVQRGTSVVPKTAQKNRMAENLTLFTLSKVHMDKISMLASEHGEVRYLDPRNHIGFDLFDEHIDQPMI